MPTPIVVNDASGQEEVVIVGTATTEEEEGSQLLNLEGGDVAVGQELQQDGVEATSVAVHLEVGQEAVGPELQQDGVEATSVAVDPTKGTQVCTETERSVDRHGVLEANAVSKMVDAVSADPRFPVVRE